MSDSENRILGRDLAKRVLTPEEIALVSGGSWSRFGTLYVETMCYVGYDDGVHEYDTDDCTSD